MYGFTMWLYELEQPDFTVALDGSWTFFLQCSTLCGRSECWRGTIRWLLHQGLGPSDLSVHFRIMLLTSSPHCHLCDPPRSVQAITPTPLTPQTPIHREHRPPQAAVSSTVRYTHKHYWSTIKTSCIKTLLIHDLHHHGQAVWSFNARNIISNITCISMLIGKMKVCTKYKNVCNVFWIIRVVNVSHRLNKYITWATSSILI